MSDCPHVITSRGGTSYCELAQVTVRRIDSLEKVVEAAREVMRQYPSDSPLTPLVQLRVSLINLDALNSKEDK